MTIDKAIKILTNLNQQEEIVGWLDIKPAVQIGIEALKWRRHCERVNAPNKYDPLPGETED